MEGLHDDLILKLNIIGRLSDSDNSDCKLGGVRSGAPTIDHCSTFSSLSRWWHGDSRGTTVEFVSKTLCDCAELVELYAQSTFLTLPKGQTDVSEYQRNRATEILDILTSISKALERSSKGLTSLKATYKANCRITGKLDIQITKSQHIILQIASVTEKFTNELNHFTNKKH